VGLLLLSFLNSGVTNAVFQSEGKLLWWIDALKIKVNLGASSLDISLGGILSSPVALKGSTSCSNLATPATLISNVLMTMQ